MHEPRLAPMALILAGNYPRAQVVAEAHGFARNRWRYVDRQDDLHGRSSTDVIIADSWFNRPAAQGCAKARFDEMCHVLAYLDAHEFRVLHEPKH